jgi:hypothetical protein
VFKELNPWNNIRIMHTNIGQDILTGLDAWIGASSGTYSHSLSGGDFVQGGLSTSGTVDSSDAKGVESGIMNSKKGINIGVGSVSPQ